MARQTRAQRKARREQQAEADVAKRTRTRQVRPAAAEVPKSQTGARRVPGGGSRRFVSESWAELRKVEWPNQRQVMQGTVVVLIACAIVGAYLWSADLVLQRLVEDVFLRK